MRDDLDIPVPLGGPSYRMSRASGGMDANTRRLLMLAGGIGGALALLVGAWSLTAHRRTGVPVIEAAAGPVRVKPANPGGLQIFGGDDSAPGGGQDATASVAPPPESPDPQGLRAQEEKPARPPAPAVSENVPSPPSPAIVAQKAPPSAATPTRSPASVSVPAQSDPVPMPKPVPAARLPAATEPAIAPPTGGATQVQLAALTSEEQANAEWARLSKKMPDLFGVRHPAVSRTEHDGKTWFRLRTGGFADVAQATAFCHRVREKGAACAIASF
jgi:hypothetical protein